MAVPDESLFLSNAYDHHYRKDRSNHGGGILVYLSSDLVHKRIPELELFCPESIWISVKVNSSVYLLGTFYSPKTSDADFFQLLT